VSKQQDEGNRETSLRRPENFGRRIAKEKSVVKEHQSNVNLKSVHPIDTLLVQQLENILDGERALRARYSAIEPEANTPEVRMAFSRELSDLKNRADRLYRYVSAMDYYGALESNRSSLYAPVI